MEPTPYLRKKWQWLLRSEAIKKVGHHYMLKASNQRKVVRQHIVADLGCGNGRNSSFMWAKGFQHVYPIDMCGDHALQLKLGADTLPFRDGVVDIVLCNYMLMFLSRTERYQLIQEIGRVLKPGGTVMVELYPAKDAYKYSQDYLLNYKPYGWTDWDKVHNVKDRFILRKPVPVEEVKC